MRNGDDVVDILKPAYYYGGIPIPQKIFERVYAADRTANEAPALLLSKRLLTLKTDTTKIFGPNSQFNTQMELTAQYRNNFGLQVIGTEEEVQQFETSLTELNETIYTQFALACAAGNCPVTKIMGTPPKGMDATGEYDEASYHEECESLQTEIAQPLLERHHLCQMRSLIAPKFGMAPLETEVSWRPMDSYTTKEKAEINKTKADTAKTYADIGAIDGTDVRQSIIEDPDSGYNGLDPIVPDGPGDREHEQEVAAELLANSNAPSESKGEKKQQAMDWDENDHPRKEDGEFAKVSSHKQNIEKVKKYILENHSHTITEENGKFKHNNRQYNDIEAAKSALYHMHKYSASKELNLEIRSPKEIEEANESEIRKENFKLKRLAPFMEEAKKIADDNEEGDDIEIIENYAESLADDHEEKENEEEKDRKKAEHEEFLEKTKASIAEALGESGKGSSMSGSHYFEIAGLRIRISDHQLPPTYERMHGSPDIEIAVQGWWPDANYTINNDSDKEKVIAEVKRRIEKARKEYHEEAEDAAYSPPPGR